MLACAALARMNISPSPKDWYPCTWSPSGSTLLLVGAGPVLAIWSLRAPGRV